MWQLLFDLQRTIHAQVSNMVSDAVTGGFPAYAAMLPLGIVFGAVHALTPGHSKSLLASNAISDDTRLRTAVLTPLALALTHVTSAVLIAAFALPLVSRTLGSAGKAFELTMISRGLLVLVGLWMVWQARHPHKHTCGSRWFTGVVAGLVPCPLTLFMMTLAMARGVPVAGLTFAVAMLIGVATTLCAVVMASVLFRRQLNRLLVAFPGGMERGSQRLMLVSGLLLIGLAANEMPSLLPSRR